MIKTLPPGLLAADYILCWLRVGTNSWDKFVTPNERGILIVQACLRVFDERGVIYNLLADRWQISTDTDVNYMLTAERLH